MTGRSVAPLLLLLGLGACSDSVAPLEPPPFLPTAGETFVVSEIRTARTAGELAEHALDIDGDEIHDNALGQMISSAYSFFGGDPQEDLDGALARGEMLHLIAIGAPDDDFLDTARVFLGEDTDDDPSNNGRGAELRVREGSTLRGALFGDNEGPVLSFGGGRLVLENTLFGAVILPLREARLEASRRPDGSIVGVIGGAILTDDVDALLKPALAASVMNDVTNDCGGSVFPDGCCEADTRGDAWIRLFDDNEDCSVSVEEVTTNGLVDAFLAADLDIDGDEIVDALSVGFGFTAEPATFDIPPSVR